MTISGLEIREACVADSLLEHEPKIKAIPFIGAVIESETYHLFVRVGREVRSKIRENFDEFTEVRVSICPRKKCADDWRDAWRKLWDQNGIDSSFDIPRALLFGLWSGANLIGLKLLANENGDVLTREDKYRFPKLMNLQSSLIALKKKRHEQYERDMVDLENGDWE